MSKTILQIFDERYPLSEIETDPLKLVEAIGYLNCLEQFIPSSEKEINSRKAFLFVSLLSLVED